MLISRMFVSYDASNLVIALLTLLTYSLEVYSVMVSMPVVVMFSMSFSRFSMLHFLKTVLASVIIASSSKCF